MRKTAKLVLKKSAKKNLKFNDLKSYLMDLFASFKQVSKDDIDQEYFESSMKSKIELEKRITINNNVVFYV